MVKAANLPAIPDANPDWSPEMAALNYTEQIFVSLLFSHKNATAACKKAGFHAASAEAYRTKAYQLTHTPRIVAAIRAEAQRRTLLLLPKATKAIGELLDHPEHSDYFKAIQAVRQDAGVAQGPIRKALEVNVVMGKEADDGSKAKLQRIIDFCRAHGRDPVEYLGFNPETGEVKKPVDAEFSEVPSEQATFDEEFL